MHILCLYVQKIILKCHPLKIQSKCQSFSDVRVRVRKFRTLQTLRTRTQRVCLFTHLYCKEVNISQKISEISIFFFLKILLFPL
jgi:hypothetical protein